MLTNDDLQAISKLLDEKLGPINSRLDIIELKQDRTSKKLDDLQLDVKIAERDVRREIHSLKDEMEAVIEVLRQNELVPN